MSENSSSSTSSHNHHNGEKTPSDERQLEALHFRDVLEAFRDYQNWMKLEQLRRDNHLEALPSKYKQLLPLYAGEFRRKGLEQAIVANQVFLNFVVEAQEDAEYTESLLNETNPSSSSSSSSSVPIATTVPHPKSSSAHFSKVKSTLHQIVRDWSDEGIPEREATYGVLLSALERVLPVTDTNYNKLKVLVPGSGLGRLVFDLVLKGYAAQGNEFSYFMLFVAHAILNCIPQKDYVTIHPWIHTASNHLRIEDMLRPVSFPDIDPACLIETNPEGDMSMVAGDFLQVYGTPSQQSAWDSVLTCYFIDTAPIIFDYIDLIYRILKPGGVWINTGPLLYHWEEIPIQELKVSSPTTSSSASDNHDDDDHPIDDRYYQSIELTYNEIRHAIETCGFIIEEESSHRSNYASNRLSLMKTVFTGMTFIARKPS